MPSVMETGFTSEAQEIAIKMNQPELYARVFAKHGHYKQLKRMAPVPVPEQRSVQSRSKGRKR